MFLQVSNCLLHQSADVRGYFGGTGMPIPLGKVGVDIVLNLAESGEQLDHLDVHGLDLGISNIVIHVRLKE